MEQEQRNSSRVILSPPARCSIIFFFTVALGAPFCSVAALPRDRAPPGSVAALPRVLDKECSGCGYEARL